MKKLNAYWVTLIVIVTIVAGYYTYHKVIIKNVFEEMYDSYYSFSVLGSIDDMPQIEPIPRDEKGAAVVVLNYKDIQTLSILYSTLVSEEVYLDIIYVYDMNTHILKNYVRFYGDNIPETKDKVSQTRELLQKYNISKEQLQKISDEGLDKVLTDWKNYSGSSYSKDNMGRLTIEKDEFLK